MGREALLNHFQANELGYNVRMFLLSLFSMLQLAVMLAYLMELVRKQN